MFRTLASISILLFLPLCVRAQTAADYFHRGAQQYIFGLKDKAKIEVMAGLRLFPEDPQLNSLAGLLKKEEQQQPQQKNQDQNQKQEQNQQSPQNQSQQKQDSQQNQQQQQQQQQQEQQQAAQNQMGRTNEQQQASQAQQAEADPSKQEQQQQEAAAAAGQMTREQAERLLDSQKGQEKMLSLKEPPKPSNRRVKDW